MVSVVHELKGKLAEIGARLIAIREEAYALEGKKAAFETVIAVYDPSFATTAPPKQAKTNRSTPAKRITDLLKGKDLRRGILITLRDAEAPLRATDIAQRFVAREGLDAAADGFVGRAVRTVLDDARPFGEGWADPVCRGWRTPSRLGDRPLRNPLRPEVVKRTYLFRTDVKARHSRSSRSACH